MIRDYYVPIPPHLFDVLQDISGSTSEDFDVVIAAARSYLFNFTYPVPSSDKQALEEFIMNRFILRRIGSGNVRKWRQMFKSKMVEIMPYYGRLLESEHLSFDPLINNDITTTDDAADTLDTTRDKRTDNDDTYSKSGTTHGEHETDGTHENEYEKSGTNSKTTDKDGTTSGQYSKSGTTSKETENDGTKSGQYSKSGTESGNETELNRYMDTPQGDSSRVWETDGQGNIRLSDYYITDVRGITKNASRNWSESGTNSETTHAEGSENGTSSETGTESGTSTEDIQEDGTWTEEGADSGSTHEEGTNDGTWSETGTDNRDIVEHETIDTDTTHTNENYRLGVAGVSKSNLLSEFRETFLRIYTDISEELEPLFYNLVEIDDILDFV